MNKPYIEFTSQKWDYYKDLPDELNNSFDHHSKLSLVDAYGLIFDKGESSSPVLFVRHGNTNNYRFGGFSRLSNTPFGLQTALHENDIAQKENTGPFRKLSDDPISYGYGTQVPFSEYRYFSDHAVFQESNILDAVAEPFPYCVIQHQGEIANFTEIIQPAVVSGTFEGKQVKFIGSYDKVYQPLAKSTDIGSTMAYIMALDHGIRPDGRKESVVIWISSEGKSMGGYYLEGEEPVSTTEVIMDAEWSHLPYVDDGTVGYKDATFYIGQKTIHFQGKWGCKGITAHPRMEKHGQSQIFGTWYEGDIPYNHLMFTTFHENMEAFDYKIQKLGFKIID